MFKGVPIFVIVAKGRNESQESGAQQVKKTEEVEPAHPKKQVPVAPMPQAIWP